MHFLFGSVLRLWAISVCFAGLRNRHGWAGFLWSEVVFLTCMCHFWFGLLCMWVVLTWFCFRCIVSIPGVSFKCVSCFCMALFETVIFGVLFLFWDFQFHFLLSRFHVWDFYKFSKFMVQSLTFISFPYVCFVWTLSLNLATFTPFFFPYFKYFPFITQKRLFLTFCMVSF